MSLCAAILSLSGNPDIPAVRGAGGRGKPAAVFRAAGNPDHGEDAVPKKNGAGAGLEGLPKSHTELPANGNGAKSAQETVISTADITDDPQVQACLDAIEQKPAAAFHNLYKSIECGFKDADYLLRDSDFENVQGDPRWKVVVQCICGMQ